MSTVVPVFCKGCGGAIAPPGPIITMIGFDGQFHVSCTTSAALLAERARCSKVVRDYAARMKAAGDCNSAHFVLNAADMIDNPPR